MPFPKQRMPKGKSSSSKPKATNTDEYRITDPRFSKLQTDPRFKLPSRKRTRTKLDKRFEGILKDEEFTRKASVDRYGRPIGGERGKGMERFYVGSGSGDDSGEDGSEGEDDEIVKRELRRVEEEGDGEDEDDEDESDEEVEMVELDEDAVFEEEEEQAEGIPMGEVSSRIACVNLDWDNIRSVDLMAVASSFAPPTGKILSVTVYPSEFGRERMEREELEGPPKELFQDNKKKENEDSEEDSDEDSEEEDERVKNDLLKEDKGDELNSTALRAYQLDRLKYYYAIIHCSSDVVAKKLYEDMDGREYLSSANFFDLRFVPDEVTFDETPRDVCKEVPRDYRPAEFVTEALTHSNVKLTWDADDKQRKEVQKRAFSRKEIDENDLQAYIGSASESEESEEEAIVDEDPNSDMMSVTSKSTKADKRDLLRAALGLPAEAVKSSKKDASSKTKGPVGNMQVSFTPGLSAAAATDPASKKMSSVFENDPRDIEETTMERYVRKERERKARRKERMKARREGRDPDLVGASDDEAAAPPPVQEEEEAGFDDPFFTDPLNADKESKKARKAEKARLRAEKEANEAAEGTKREELELLMAGEDDSIRHFDMREIKRQEKAKKLKGKKKNKGKVETETAAEGEAFKIDTQDPRFSALFESHEFAIDPSNPKFKKTEGMNALMEEGRKKRARVRDEDHGGGKSNKKAKTASNGGDDLKKLVEKVKKKVKA
ncbi:hypothetical protein E6O75_ATG03889 [Venturia nashicola]|uniref:Uncharacterized protein n=1 Tax=Venturia nashicola TaxID=86259 RepID=A0A4Z1PK60_9PEZI|nr:hypothetical protein E6O75_ATG03889 [Venturia nashicola]